jgi:hypothetical protein
VSLAAVEKEHTERDVTMARIDLLCSSLPGECISQRCRAVEHKGGGGGLGLMYHGTACGLFHSVFLQPGSSARRRSITGKYCISAAVSAKQPALSQHVLNSAYPCRCFIIYRFPKRS